MVNWLTRNWVILVVICIVDAIHLPFSLNPALLSDEGVYTYAGFAISRGTIPYAQIALPQPPLGYSLLAFEVIVSQGVLLYIRLLNLFFFSIALFASYKFFTRIQTFRGAALLGTSLAALYPTILTYPFSTPIEYDYFSLFVYSAFYIYSITITNECNKLVLFGSGILLSLAFLDWFPAIFVLLAIAVTEIAVGFYKRKKPTELIHRSLIFLGGFAVPITVALALIAFLFHALNQFYTQTILLQSSIRTPFGFAEKTTLIVEGLRNLDLLFSIALLGIITICIRARKLSIEKNIIPLLLFGVTFLLLLTIPRVFFPHYLAFLVPFLGFFCGSVLTSLNLRKFHYLNLMNIFIIVILVVVLIPSVSSSSSYLYTGYDNPYNIAEQQIGAYVHSITTNHQFIWTSEGGIAVFAQRLIVVPNSTDWPLAAFYNDVFPSIYVDTSGKVHEGEGLVTSAQFIESWKSNDVKVLVFIFGNGPVPYPDPILWNGGGNMTGVSSWVMANFHLSKTFRFPKIPYNYTVWIRN
jgi:hypothetical protein